MLGKGAPIDWKLGAWALFVFLSVGCRAPVAGALPCAEGLITPVGGPFDLAMRRRVLDEVGLVLKTQAYAGKVDFNVWDGRVANARERLEGAETREAFGKEVNDLLRGFGISHLVLVTDQQLNYLKPGNPGFGFRCQGGPQEWLVVQVKAGSPAEKAGLRGGDRVLALDGGAFDEKRLAQLQERQKPIQLTVSRQEASFVLTIPCMPFDWDSAPTLSWPERDLALLRVPTFRKPIYEPAQMERLFQEAARAKGMILDLRGNTGGNTDNFRDLASHFFQRRRTLGYQVSRATEDAFRLQFDRGGAMSELALRGESLESGSVVNTFSGELIVLVDHWTHSSAELCAAALQELGRARLLGTRTGGQVLTTSSAELTELSGGFRLQWPAAVPLSPRKHLLEGVGVQPDMELDGSAVANDAVILAKALTLFRRG